MCDQRVKVFNRTLEKRVRGTSTHTLAYSIPNVGCSIFTQYASVSQQWSHDRFRFPSSIWYHLALAPFVLLVLWSSVS